MLSKNWKSYVRSALSVWVCVYAYRLHIFLQQQHIKLYSTHFIFCVRFFSGGETARRMAKDLLKQELDKMEQAQLKASAEGQGGTKEAEPAENQVLLQAQVRVASAVYITEFWRNMMNLLKVPRQQLSKCKCIWKNQQWVSKTALSSTGQTTILTFLSLLLLQ